MGFTGTQPNDAASVPISSEYSPQNNTFPAMQGADGAYVDQFGNPSTAPVMSFIQPRVNQWNTVVTGSGAKSLSCPFKNPVTGGNSIVVCIGAGDTVDAFTGFQVTDSQGNAYTPASTTPQGASLESGIYFASGIKSGLGSNPALLPLTSPIINTVTFNITGPTAIPTGISMKIYEVFGLISVDALDQIASGTGAAGTIIRPGALIPTTPNQIAFTALATQKAVVITPPGGFSNNDGTLFPWGGQIGAFDSQYKSIANFQTLDVQAAFSLPSAWSMSIATFRSVVLPVQGVFNQAPSTNALISTIKASTKPVQFLVANSTRRGMSLFNASTSILYLAFGPAVGTGFYTTQIQPGALYEMPQPLFIGVISGIWDSANGYANVTEMI